MFFSYRWQHAECWREAVKVQPILDQVRSTTKQIMLCSEKDTESNTYEEPAELGSRVSVHQ